MMRSRGQSWFLWALLPLAMAAGAATPVTEMIPMRDGVRLATDIHLPPEASGEAWPVALRRTPYGRAALAGSAAQWASAEVVFVAQDVRGRFDSEGEHLTFFTDGWGELQDGVDTIAWIASQPWCDGNVIMEGNSATAITGLLAAGAVPAALRGVVSENGAWDLYDDAVFTGGVFRRALVESWLALTDAEVRIGEFVAHPLRDAWWDPVLMSLRTGTVDVPILHVTGWFDLYASSVLRASAALNVGGGTGARGRQVVIVGPWGHDTLGEQVQGDLVFPDNSLWSAEISGIYGDFHAETLRGEATGLFSRPTYLYYLMGNVDDPSAPGNIWLESETWPPPDTRDAVFYLRADGGLTPTPPDSGEAASSSYISDPADLLATIGGANLFISAGPRDQSSLESRDDVLTFTTAPLADPMAIVGNVRANLLFSSSAPDADVFVKLTDVYPDGRSILFAEGALQMRRRGGLDREDLMVPGEVYEVEISVGELALVIAEGHRLRISVASSNFPRFEPNPQTGAPLALDDTETAVATHTLHHGGQRLSRLTIPLQEIGDQTPANRSPIAVDVTASLEEDTVIAGNVMQGDRDPDGDPLSLTGLTQPSNGTAADAGGGILRYTPNPDFNGTDRFTYTISDGRGGAATGAVTLDVTPVNDAPVATDDSAATTGGIPIYIDLFANDFDVDGDEISLTALGSAVSGTVENLGGGSIRYNPAPGFVGLDSFAYAIADSPGVVANAQAVVTVFSLSGNRPPVANDITVTVNANSSVSGNVLLNDSDPDGDPLRLGAFTLPANGTVEDIGAGNGLLRYTPDAGFSGADLFTYTADDGRGGTDSAAVRISVRSATASPG